MPRHRLGVALLVPGPLASEVDGLRRALGDRSLSRLPPHLTLVPPVNVRDHDLDQARAVLRRAAARTRPLRLTLGPPTTFLPANPVLYLAVGGDLSALRALREALFVPPLERPLTFPFVPHVTLADGGEPGRIEAALAALASYRVDVTFDRVTLLQEGEGRVWAPLADAALEAPAVVGRGGLELEITVSSQLDPLVRGLVAHEPWAEHGDGLVLTARRAGQVVGAAAGWSAGSSASLTVLVVDPAVRGEGIGSHLLAAFVAESIDRGCAVLRHLSRSGPRAEAFYRSRGWSDDATAPPAALVRRLG